MPSPVTLKSWLSNTKRTWGQITQFAIFILGVVGSFLLPPPGWTSADGSKTIVRFAQFIVTVLVGLIFLLIQRWSKKKYVLHWALLTLVFLALSIAAFFAYQNFWDSRTCQYDRRTVVIVTRFT